MFECQDPHSCAMVMVLVMIIEILRRFGRWYISYTRLSSNIQALNVIEIDHPILQKAKKTKKTKKNG